MKRRAPFLLLVAVAAVLVVGLTVLFRLRLAQGDVFPAYSSQRADPLGLRALHDSLAQIPGLRIERRFRPLETLEAQPARTIVLAGFRVADWTQLRREEFDALDAAVRNGSRLVIALHAQAAGEEQRRIEAEKKREAEAKKRRADDDEEGLAEPKPVYVDLHRRWGVDVKDRWLMERTGGAVIAAGAPAGLPARVGWQSDMYFARDEATGWQAIYRRGGEPVLVERRHGLGSIVLAGDSYFLSNEALQRDRSSALLAWMVGPHPRVLFDETHLGVTVDPTIAALARRYGLAGAFFTLLLLALLFVWRRMALFVPPAPASDEVTLTYHPAAGLEALLRRAVPAGELAATCLAEWTPSARASDRARVEAAQATLPKNSPVAARYNAAVQALRRK